VDSVDVKRKSDMMLQLNGELDSFRELVSFSGKWLERIDSMPPGVMQEVLNYRQEWISRFGNRKDDWVSLARQAGETYAANFIASMTKAVADLQVIDEQICHCLEERRLNYLNQISSFQQTKRKKVDVDTQHSVQGKRVDIVQE